MSALNLLDCLLDPLLGGGSYIFERITEIITDAGLPTYSVVHGGFLGNVQPAPGKERELLEEEDRLKGAIVIYSAADLTAGAGQIKADRVFYRGGAYRVVLSEPWREHADYTKALAVLERPANEAGGEGDAADTEGADDTEDEP